MKRSLSIKEMLERQQRLIEASHLRLETSYTLLDGGVGCPDKLSTWQIFRGMCTPSLLYRLKQG
jgi:hypothetical protein